MVCTCVCYLPFLPASLALTVWLVPGAKSNSTCSERGDWSLFSQARPCSARSKRKTSSPRCVARAVRCGACLSSARPAAARWVRQRLRSWCEGSGAQLRFRKVISVCSCASVDSLLIFLQLSYSCATADSKGTEAQTAHQRLSESQALQNGPDYIRLYIMIIYSPWGWLEGSM